MARQDEEEFVAAVDLIGRTGGKFFQVGYLDDDVPVEKARWYAYVQYQGSRIIVENKPSPYEAVFELARTLLTGAQCKCGKLVQLSDFGAYAFKKTTLADGTTWTWKEARKAGMCKWQRKGRKWVSACGRGEEIDAKAN